MNAQETQKKIAAVLAREELLSVMECKTLLMELTPMIGMVESRIVDIRQREHGPGRDGAETITAGPVRLQVLRFGSIEEVAALDKELEELKIVRSQLVAQREPIMKRMEVAADEEAASGLPNLHEKLNAAIDAAMAQAQTFKGSLAAAAVALQEVEAAYGRLNQAYAVRGMTYPRVSGTEEQVEQINKLAAAANGSLCPPGFHPRALFFLRGSLGMKDNRDHLDRGKPGFFEEAA